MLRDPARRGGRTIRAVLAQAASAGRNGLDPGVVAAVVERAVTTRRPPTRYLVGREAKLVARLSAVLPDRVLDALVTRCPDQLDSQ
jgi:hypothetical protein